MHLLGKENPSFHLKNIQTKETKEIKSVAMHSDEFTKTEKGKVLHLKELSLKIKEDKSPRWRIGVGEELQSVSYSYLIRKEDEMNLIM